MNIIVLAGQTESEHLQKSYCGVSQSIVSVNQDWSKKRTVVNQQQVHGWANLIDACEQRMNNIAKS